MAVTRLSDVIVPEVFTDYVVHNTMEKSALVQSGIMTRNAEIATQLQAGADSFNVPFWRTMKPILSMAIPTTRQCRAN